MKRILLAVMLFIGLAASAQNTYKVISVSGGYYLNSTKNWTYDPVRYPAGMNIIITESTIRVTDQANSRYDVLPSTFKEEENKERVKGSWSAYDETNTQVLVTLYFYKNTGRKSLNIMYDRSYGYQMFSYEY